MIRRRRLHIQSLLLLLLLSEVYGKRVAGHVRAIAKTRGDASTRRLSTTRVKGERKSNTTGWGQEESDSVESENLGGMHIAVFASSEDESQTFEEPSRDYEEQVALQSESRSKGSKQSKVSKQKKKKSGGDKGGKSKLAAKKTESGNGSSLHPDEELQKVNSDPTRKSSNRSNLAVKRSQSSNASRSKLADKASELSSLDSLLVLNMTWSGDQIMEARRDSDSEDSMDEMKLPTDSPSTPVPAPTMELSATDLPFPTFPPESDSIEETFSPTVTPAIVGKEEQASASYDFEPGTPRDPTPAEVFRLEIATTAFYIGVFADAYKDNPGTIFTNIVAEVEQVTFSENATPPIDINWQFQVAFDSTSTVIPSSEEILKLIYGDEETLEEYMDIYLHNKDDVWSSVTTVAYDEASASGGTDFPSTNVEASFTLDFTPDTVEAEPSQEEVDRFVTALTMFYTALLTQEYSNADDTELATVTGKLNEILFTPDSSMLQANLELVVFFSDDALSPASSDSIITIMQENAAELLRFIQENFSWQEGDIWPDVSDLKVDSFIPIYRAGERPEKLDHNAQ